MANATRWARAYQHLLAIVRQTNFEGLGAPNPAAPYSADTLPDRRAARRLVRWSLLAEHLTKGESLENAITVEVRSLVAGGENDAARALSQSLQRWPTTRVAGHLGTAVCAALLGWYRLAWFSFGEVPAEVWRRLAADEYFRAGFQVDADAALDAARRLLEDRPDDVSAGAWLTVARRTLVAGDRALAWDIYRVAEGVVAASGDVDAEVSDELAWLGRWLAPVPSGPATEPPAGHLSFAVLDYKMPERGPATTNIGDHVQTSIALGHLARHQQLRFTSGEPDLGAFATELQQRVLPERRLDTQPRAVNLVPVQRDASTLDDVPPDTWTILFGWHMKETSDGFDFPPHPNLRPIIVSFHCKHVRMLTPAAIEYLKTYGPVGCRDWATVDILQSAGVPAFLSGCITTTIDVVFPPMAAEKRPGPDAPTAYVEVLDPPDGATTLSQVYPEVREDPIVVNLRRAIAQLETYRRDYSLVVTSRLHCHLPCRSLGVPTEFRPRHAADLRYDGLIGISDEAFSSIRTRMLDKLETVTTAIVEGRSEDEVYAEWRALCAEDVANAERRRGEVPPMPEPWFDVTAACRAVRSIATTIERCSEVEHGDEVHVALALDDNLTEQLHVVTTSLVDNSSRPLHLWILSRGHDRATFDGFAAAFPEVTTTWLPCDAVEYEAVHLLRHTTASTMDRLLLPELLGEVARIVYIDIDTLTLGDIGELYDWDLDGAPLAARSVVGSPAVSSGFTYIVDAATRLHDDPDASYDLVRRMSARFPFDFDAFNAGLLLLDLDRMRADHFCREFLPFVQRYGMNDQEVLNCYAGPHRARLTSGWNAQPTKEIVTDPQVIHWTGSFKPWSEAYVPLQELWETYEGRLRQRRIGAGGQAESPRA